jgi:hypothetical protein
LAAGTMNEALKLSSKQLMKLTQSLASRTHISNANTFSSHERLPAFQKLEVSPVDCKFERTSEFFEQKQPKQKLQIHLGTNHREPGPSIYDKHPVNRCLSMSNDLISLANRLSQFDCSNLNNRELRLLKLLNISVPKLDRSQFLQSKKFTDYLKDKALVIATHGFQIVYNMIAQPKTEQGYLGYFGFEASLGTNAAQINYPVRFYVAFGNNSHLVKNILRTRWWLMPIEIKAN